MAIPDESLIVAARELVATETDRGYAHDVRGLLAVYLGYCELDEVAGGEWMDKAKEVEGRLIEMVKRRIKKAY